MGTLRSDDILVGVDGSAAGAAALRWAARTAARRECGLTLVHAFAWPAYAASYGLPPATWSDNAFHAQAEALLEREASLAHEFAPSVRVHGEVLLGTPAAVLTEASRRYAMVVVGNRGSGGFSELLLGSVSSQLARHGAGVIVVVPQDADPPEPTRPRVVVGTDGSAGAEPALRFAFAEAASLRATLTVVRAWELPSPSWRDEFFPSGQGRADLEATEAQLLAESALPWQEKYPQVPVEHQLVADHPARALTAAGQGAQLLVVGAHGHGGFGGLHLGSVGLQVMHHAPCPVAVVRPGHHETTDPH